MKFKGIRIESLQEKNLFDITNDYFRFSSASFLGEKSNAFENFSAKAFEMEKVFLHFLYLW